MNSVSVTRIAPFEQNKTVFKQISLQRCIPGRHLVQHFYISFINQICALIHLVQSVLGYQEFAVQHRVLVKQVRSYRPNAPLKSQCGWRKPHFYLSCARRHHWNLQCGCRKIPFLSELCTQAAPGCLCAHTRFAASLKSHLHTAWLCCAGHWDAAGALNSFPGVCLVVSWSSVRLTEPAWVLESVIKGVCESFREKSECRDGMKAFGWIEVC